MLIAILRLEEKNHFNTLIKSIDLIKKLINKNLYFFFNNKIAI